MRIVIDMQGAQSSGSKQRGIGRYTKSFVRALVKNKGEHEVVLLLNGMFPDSVDEIKSSFRRLLPESAFHTWYSASGVAYLDKRNDFRRKAAELIREAVIEALEPDVLMITSMVEGGIDNAVTSLSRKNSYLSACVLYDLIPLVYPDKYFVEERSNAWYSEKILHVTNADILLSISASSAKEAVRYLDFSESKVFNISSDADQHFKIIDITPNEKKDLFQKYGINAPFVMYTGGIDHRKNISGLFHAFSMLGSNLLSSYQLAIVCNITEERKQHFLRLAKRLNLHDQQVVFTGFVSDEDLVRFYNLCDLFVFPSLHEGYGLPVLEAMRCGAPVIASNSSSIPEVVNNELALFDPNDVKAMSDLMSKCLSDFALREELKISANNQALTFSWDITARRAIMAFEQTHSTRLKREGTEKIKLVLDKLISDIAILAKIEFKKEVRLPQRFNMNLVQLAMNIDKTFQPLLNN